MYRRRWARRRWQRWTSLELFVQDALAHRVDVEAVLVPLRRTDRHRDQIGRLVGPCVAVVGRLPDVSGVRVPRRLRPARPQQDERLAAPRVERAVRHGCDGRSRRQRVPRGPGVKGAERDGAVPDREHACRVLDHEAAVRTLETVGLPARLPRVALVVRPPEAVGGDRVQRGAVGGVGHKRLGPREVRRKRRPRPVHSGAVVEVLDDPAVVAGGAAPGVVRGHRQGGAHQDAAIVVVVVPAVAVDALFVVVAVPAVVVGVVVAGLVPRQHRRVHVGLVDPAVAVGVKAREHPLGLGVRRGKLDVRERPGRRRVVPKRRVAGDGAHVAVAVLVAPPHGVVHLGVPAVRGPDVDRGEAGVVGHLAEVGRVAREHLAVELVPRHPAHEERGVHRAVGLGARPGLHRVRRPKHGGAVRHDEARQVLPAVARRQDVVVVHQQHVVRPPHPVRPAALADARARRAVRRRLPRRPVPALVPRRQWGPVPDRRDDVVLPRAVPLRDGRLERNVVGEVAVGLDQLERRSGGRHDEEPLVRRERHRPTEIERDPLVVVRHSHHRVVRPALHPVVKVRLPRARPLHVGARAAVPRHKGPAHRRRVQVALAVDAAVEDVGVVERLVRLPAVHRLVRQRRLGVDEVVGVVWVERKHGARPVGEARPVGRGGVDDVADEDVPAETAPEHRVGAARVRHRQVSRVAPPAGRDDAPLAAAHRDVGNPDVARRKDVRLAADRAVLEGVARPEVSRGVDEVPAGGAVGGFVDRPRHAYEDVVPCVVHHPERLDPGVEDAVRGNHPVLAHVG
mmetsp:Transcript_24669/g.74022  ORF Transcript_24669/g.74022 Transcript_24669/m.74022 type:complete len:793 (+) Transcript_24669:118-2496(+)